MKRPPDSNADAWALFLSMHLTIEDGYSINGIPYCAVQIAEALDDAQARIAALEEALTEISSLDYKRAAVNMAATKAVEIARAALEVGE